MIITTRFNLGDSVRLIPEACSNESGHACRSPELRGTVVAVEVSRHGTACAVRWGDTGRMSKELETNLTHV